MSNRIETIDSIVNKARHSAEVSQWYTNFDTRLEPAVGSFWDEDEDRYVYSYDKLRELLDMLDNETLSTVLGKYESIVEYADSHDAFLGELKRRGLLNIPPAVTRVGDERQLRVRHNRFLAERPKGFIVLDDKNNIKRRGCSHTNMQADIESVWSVRNRDAYIGLIKLAHASIVADRYGEFYKLLVQRSQLILDMIGAAPDTYEMIQCGVGDTGDVPPIMIHDRLSGYTLAHLSISSTRVCICTDGGGAYHIALPQDIEDARPVAYLVARLLLVLCGIVCGHQTGGSGFFDDKRLPLCRMHDLSDAMICSSGKELYNYIMR